MIEYEYLPAYIQEQLEEIADANEFDITEAETIYNIYPIHAPELDFIRQNLKPHINCLLNIINSSLNL